MNLHICDTRCTAWCNSNRRFYYTIEKDHTIKEVELSDRQNSCGEHFIIYGIAFLQFVE